MKKRIALSAMTTVCGISAYYVYKKKINNPFMSKKEIQAFDTTFSQPYGKKDCHHPENILLSKHCCQGADSSRTGINNHVLILGGSEHEKTELMQANLLQRNGSYIVMESSGELLATTGVFFEQSGYEIKVLHLSDAVNSMHYNPLCYLEEEADVRMMARYILETQPFDDMSLKAAELALVEALILYLWRFKSICTFSRIYKIIEEMGKTTHVVTSMFDEVARNNPDELCLKRFQHFKELANDDFSGIITDITKRLSYLNAEKYKILTSDDEMDLKNISKKPTIVYIITGSDKNESAWLGSMLVIQMIDLLSKLKKSEDVYHLKYPVRFLLDDICGNPPIKGLPGRLSSNRRLLMREVSFLLFSNRLEEIYGAYPEDLDSLLFACDTVVCYQSACIMSGRVISMLWGGKCVRTHNKKTPLYRIASRFDEYDLLNIKPDQVVIIVRGLKPIRDAAYQIEDHLDVNRLGSVRNQECIFTYIRSGQLNSFLPESTRAQNRREGEI